MRKNIFIRMLCLLLCAGVIMPVVEAGAWTLIFKYDPITGELQYGVTTNEMAYVDQFFNGHGGYSDLGDELLAWLDMGSFENKDDSERVNSGYLMLEQEIEHQVNDPSYAITDKITTTVRTSLDTITSLGTNWLVELASDGILMNKFPGAGKSAVIYYKQLYQIYLEYQDQVMAELLEIDTALEITGGMIDTVTEYSDVKGIETEVALVKFTEEYNTAANVYNRLNDSAPEFETEVYALIRGGGGVSKRSTVVYSLENIYVFPGASTVFDYTSRGQKASASMAQIINDSKQYNFDAVFVVPTRLNKTLDSKTVGEILDEGFEAAFGQPGVGNKFANMQLKQLESLLNIMSPNELNLENYAGDTDTLKAVQRSKNSILKRVNADYEEVKDQYYAELDASKKRLDEAEMDKNSAEAEVQQMEKFDEWARGLEVAGAGVSSIVNLYNTKVQQGLYLITAAGVKDDYVQMLENWVTTLENGGGPSNHLGWQGNAHDDLIAALKAVLKDIENMDGEFQKHSEKLGMENLVMSSESLTEFTMTLFEGTAAFQRYEANLKAAKLAAAAEKGGQTAKAAGKLTKVKEFITANPLMAVSLVTNLVSQEFVNFGENTSAIYYLKWSLADSLTSRGGLLDQYNENRTHKTACAIIEALNTMKAAKYVGENYVNDYYLADFYDDLGIDSSNGMHAIFAHELMMSTGEMEMKVDPYITSAYIVYEKGVKVPVGNDTKKMTVIQGIIDADSVATTFKGRNLNAVMDHPDIANYESKSIGTIDEKVIISDVWKKNGVIQVATNADVCKDVVRIYSRGDLEVMISTDEYNALLKAQSKFNELMKKIDDTNTKLKKGEQQAIYRLEWMLLAKKWIEHIEMYDPNKVYPLIQWARD